MPFALRSPWDALSAIERLAIVNADSGDFVLAHPVREANLDDLRIWLGPGRHIQEAAFVVLGLAGCGRPGDRRRRAATEMGRDAYRASVAEVRHTT